MEGKGGKYLGKRKIVADERTDETRTSKYEIDHDLDENDADKEGGDGGPHPPP